jgi:hypothetical protein
MRALAAALTEDAVDKDTAAWLLGQVLTSDTSTGTAGDLMSAKREAAALLRSYAPKLTFADIPGAFAWPNCVSGQWPLGLHPNAESNLIKALVRLLVSQDQQWWRDTTWIVRTLEEAVVHSEDATVRSEAASYGRVLLRVILDEWILGARIPRPRAEAEDRFSSIPSVRLDPITEGPITRWAAGPKSHENGAF